MTQSQMQAHLVHYRAQLVSHERQAEAALERAYQHTLTQIQPALNKLYRDMVNALGEGEKIPIHFLYEANRLETVKRLIAREIDQYGALANMTAGQLQRTGVQLGLEAGQALLKATLPAGVRWSFGVPNPSAIANLVGATQAGSPLAELFHGFGIEAADGAGKALIAGITNGDNPRKVAGDVQQALGVSRARALTISRDQMLNAYRSASVESFKANSDVVENMVRVAELGPRTCAACIALNGTVYSLDDDPGFHVNDRCALVPQTKSWDDILGPLGIESSGIEDTTYQPQDGSDWFDNQDEATQRQILGSNAAYDLYQSGTPLKDFVGHAQDPKWGNSIYQKSVKQLTKAR